MVKDFLSQRGIGFEERDVSRNPGAAQELVRNTGQMGVPVTIINGETVVGFDRGRLEQILAQTDGGKRPTFGAAIADAGKITARQGPGIMLGAYVGRVHPGSVAESTGLASGDIIIELNTMRISDAGDLEGALNSLNKGSRFVLVYIRSNRTMTAEGVL